MCDNQSTVSIRRPAPYKNYTEKGSFAIRTQPLSGARLRIAHQAIGNRAPYSNRAISEN